MSAVPPDHWDDSGDGGLASRLPSLNVNAPVFVPNVNAAPFIPSGAFQLLAAADPAKAAPPVPEPHANHVDDVAEEAPPPPQVSLYIWRLTPCTP